MYRVQQYAHNYIKCFKKYLIVFHTNSMSLHNPLEDRHLERKRECLTSCKIRQITTKIHEARNSPYMWAAFPCVYQAFGDAYKSVRNAAHFLFAINKTLNIIHVGCTLVSYSKRCHYEQCNYVDKHSHTVLICLWRLFTCAEKKSQAMAMVYKLLAKRFYRAYNSCLFLYLRV